MSLALIESLLAEEVTPVTPSEDQGVTPKTLPHSGVAPAPPVTPQIREVSEEIREAFEERAAIREFDGGQSKQAAESDAAQELGIYRYQLKDDPTVWPFMIAGGLTLRQAELDLKDRYGPRLLAVVPWTPSTEPASSTPPRGQNT